MQPFPQTINLLMQLLPGSSTRIDFRKVTGGSINDCYRVMYDHHQSWFLKVNFAEKFPGLFEKEVQGLALLRDAGVIRIPEILLCSEAQGQQFLLMEWIQRGERTAKFWKAFGEQLAALHHHSADAMGLASANYMGSLLQQNQWSAGWPAFFTHQRLVPQVELALSSNLLQPAHVRSFEKLCHKLGTIFNTEPPALLHGDLWSGNFMCDEHAHPVLIDPAVSYGHRSVDLGLTTLFGGFDGAFYEAYDHHYPFPPGHRDQWEVANLYPLLIHLNLFGLSYLPRIVSVLNRFG